MGTLKERRKAKAVCPSCKSPDYKLDTCGVCEKPMFRCGSCQMQWQSGKDGEPYMALL